jgi:hypothetical protein
LANLAKASASFVLYGKIDSDCQVVITRNSYFEPKAYIEPLDSSFRESFKILSKYVAWKEEDELWTT